MIVRDAEGPVAHEPQELYSEGARAQLTHLRDDTTCTTKSPQGQDSSVIVKCVGKHPSSVGQLRSHPYDLDEIQPVG